MFNISAWKKSDFDLSLCRWFIKGLGFSGRAPGQTKSNTESRIHLFMIHYSPVVTALCTRKRCVADVTVLRQRSWEVTDAPFQYFCPKHFTRFEEQVPPSGKCWAERSMYETKSSSFSPSLSSLAILRGWRPPPSRSVPARLSLTCVWTLQGGG